MSVIQGFENLFLKERLGKLRVLICDLEVF